jgi:hypothetical protein
MSIRAQDYRIEPAVSLISRVNLRDLFPILPRSWRIQVSRLALRGRSPDQDLPLGGEAAEALSRRAPPAVSSPHSGLRRAGAGAIRGELGLLVGLGERLFEVRGGVRAPARPQGGEALPTPSSCGCSASSRPLAMSEAELGVGRPAQYRSTASRLAR